MHAILIGPPASGKGTQAAVLKERFKVAHISTGDMLRAAMKSGTPLGKEAEKYVSKGLLVPDDLVIQMVLERINEEDAKGGFLLDGFPRTRAQAEALDQALNQAGKAIDAVLFVDVPDETVVERISGRRSDPETGAIYHLTFNPPPADVADRVIQRDDDTEGAVKVRLEKYHNETEPVIPFYDKKGVLFNINGLDTPAAVTAAILDALG